LPSRPWSCSRRKLIYMSRMGSCSRKAQSSGRTHSSYRKTWKRWHRIVRNHSSDRIISSRWHRIGRMHVSRWLILNRWSSLLNQLRIWTVPCKLWQMKLRGASSRIPGSIIWKIVHCNRCDQHRKYGWASLRYRGLRRGCLVHSWRIIGSWLGLALSSSAAREVFVDDSHWNGTKWTYGCGFWTQWLHGTSGVSICTLLKISIKFTIFVHEIDLKVEQPIRGSQDLHFIGCLSTALSFSCTDANRWG
jgi:hypothetical protein